MYNDDDKRADRIVGIVQLFLVSFIVVPVVGLCIAAFANMNS